MPDETNNLPAGFTLDQPAASAPDALPPGFQLDADKYGTTSQQIQTGIEGIARGATFGASDYLATKLGDKPEDIKARAETNPITSNVGQMVGGAGTLIATGGIASPVEGALEGLAVPGLAAKVIGTGVEGAAFGAGSAISDAALGDPNLTGQKVLADVGMGFALGAGLGVLSHGVEAALPAATKRLSKALGNLKEGVFGTAEEPSIVTKALSIPGAVASGDSPADWTAAFFKGAQDGAPVSKLVSNLEQVRGAGDAAAKELFETAIPETIDKAIEEADAAKKATKADPSNFFIKKPVLASERSAGLTQAEKKAIGQEMLSNLSAPHDEYQEALKNFDKVFSSDGKIDSGKVEGFLKDPTDEIKKAALNDFVNKTQILAKASENYFGFQDAENSISKHVSALAKKQAELSEVAKVLKNRVSGGSARLGELGSVYAAHALGVPNPVTGAAVAALEAYKAIKNPFEMGSNLSQTFNKLKVLGDISETVGNKIAKFSKGIFAGSLERAAVVPKAVASIDKGYDKKVARIDALASDPSLLADHLAKNTDALHEAAPNVSQGIQSSMASGVQFLNSKIPRPQTQLPLSGKWEPSRVQKVKFQNYYRAVDDPVSVLKDVKDGTLTNQSMEALQAVHPDLLNEMRKHVMENLDPKKIKSMPYGTKIAIGKFLGQPVDAAMTPSAILANQASLRGPQLGNQVAPKSGRSTRAGAKNLNLSSLSATQTRDEDGEKG